MKKDIVMFECIGMLEGIEVPENIGSLVDTRVLEQRLAAGGSRPLWVDEERGDHSLKEAQVRFPLLRCEGEPPRTS